jgi:hypothetical protein
MITPHLCESQLFSSELSDKPTDELSDKPTEVIMYEDLTTEHMAHPDFDMINELQIFDSMFAVDGPFKYLDDMSVSFN